MVDRELELKLDAIASRHEEAKPKDILFLIDLVAELQTKDETLEADLLSFVRGFYDFYTDLGWGTNDARLAQARALIERGEQ